MYCTWLDTHIGILIRLDSVSTDIDPELQPTYISPEEIIKQSNPQQTLRSLEPILHLNIILSQLHNLLFSLSYTFIKLSKLVSSQERHIYKRSFFVFASLFPTGLHFGTSQGYLGFFCFTPHGTTVFWELHFSIIP